jgi:hypothetical protein
MKTISTFIAAAALAGVVAVTTSAFADQAERPVYCQAQINGHMGWAPCPAPQHVTNTGARRDEQQQHDRTVDTVSHGL